MIPARTATHTAVITRTVTTLGSPWKGDLQESLWLCFSTTSLGGTSGQNRASLQEEHQTNQGLEQKHLPLTPRTGKATSPAGGQPSSASHYVGPPASGATPHFLTRKGQPRRTARGWVSRMLAKPMPLALVAGLCSQYSCPPLPLNDSLTQGSPAFQALLLF